MTGGRPRTRVECFLLLFSAARTFEAVMERVVRAWTLVVLFVSGFGEGVREGRGEEKGESSKGSCAGWASSAREAWSSAIAMTGGSQ